MEIGLIVVAALILGVVVVLRTNGPKGKGTVGGGGYDEPRGGAGDGSIRPPSSGPDAQ